MPGDYIKCPRCELNYIKRGEEYCAVCKAELKKGPQLIFAVDDEDENELLKKRLDEEKSNYKPSFFGLYKYVGKKKDR